MGERRRVDGKRPNNERTHQSRSSDSSKNLGDGEDEGPKRSDRSYDGEPQRNGRVLGIDEETDRRKISSSRLASLTLFPATSMGLTNSPPLILKKTQALTARLNPKERAMNWIWDVLTESVMETEEEQRSKVSLILFRSWLYLPDGMFATLVPPRAKKRKS